MGILTHAYAAAQRRRTRKVLLLLECGRRPILVLPSGARGAAPLGQKNTARRLVLLVVGSISFPFPFPCQSLGGALLHSGSRWRVMPFH